MKLRTNHEIVELKDFDVKTGLHCESSAMMNALNFQGVTVSENMITGLGSAPAFFYKADDAFPFLGGRSHTMLENFCASTGIPVESASPKGVQEAYDVVKDILKKGIPVVMRVNMRYLPYLHGGKYGNKYTSFGWHFVCLVKIDEPYGVAWVTDTAYSELQTVRLNDLAKARNARKGMFQTDNFFYYFTDPSSVNIDYRTAFMKSLKRLIENYEMPDGGLNALKKLPDDIRNIEKGRNTFILKPLFYTFYGYIEEFGSGGAAFRRFLRSYFNEMSERLDMVELEKAAAIIGASCDVWTALALDFKNMSESLGGTDKTARNTMYEAAAKRAQELCAAEKNIYDAIQSLYDKM